MSAAALPRALAAEAIGTFALVFAARARRSRHAAREAEAHVTRVAELTEVEAAELGALLRRTAAVVDRLLEPEQVYTWRFSHAGGQPRHAPTCARGRSPDRRSSEAHSVRLTFNEDALKGGRVLAFTAVEDGCCALELSAGYESWTPKPKLAR